jgi:hypothetical protein
MDPTKCSRPDWHWRIAQFVIVPVAVWSRFPNHHELAGERTGEEVKRSTMQFIPSVLG